MKWFKLHNDIVHDPKIRALAFEDRWHFVALMALMNDGTLHEAPELRDELISVALGLHGIALAKCKARLMRLRLIDDDWRPVNWEKRQASTDPRAAERMRRHRDKLAEKRNVTPDVTGALRIEGEEEGEGEEEVRSNLTVTVRAPHEKVVEIYHEELPDLPRVVALNATRRKQIAMHHAGIMEGDLANWRGYFQSVRQSDFLMGRRKEWRADFDFLLKGKTPLKVLEGSYA